MPLIKGVVVPTHIGGVLKNCHYVAALICEVTLFMSLTRYCQLCGNNVFYCQPHKNSSLVVFISALYLHLGLVPIQGQY